MPVNSPFETAFRSVQETFMRHAIAHPNKTAIVCGDARITWKEFNEHCNLVANKLIQIGVSKEEKACTLLPTMPETLEVMYGIVKGGACMVPLSGLMSSSTLALMINDSDASLIFVGPGMDQLIDPIRDQLVNIPSENYISVGFKKEGYISYPDFVADSSPENPLLKFYPDELWSILYTSGTTGVPKGVMHTQYGRLMYSMSCAEGYRVHSDTITLSSTPLYTSGTTMLVIATLQIGGTIVLMPSFEPGEWLRLAEVEKCTHAFMVPTQYYMILNHSDLDKHQYYFEMMTSTGSLLRPDAKIKIIEKFGMVFWELYGLTEGPSTALDPKTAINKPASVGVPANFHAFYIIDEEGNILPPNEIGELVGYGNAMLKGYYKKPEYTKSVTWIDPAGRHFLKTGDMGRIDEEGHIYIMDRKKDMIISGGNNIYASDIEIIVNQHPDVQDSAVIAIPHEKWGETPLALVIRKHGATTSEDELKEWLNAQLSKYQRVHTVEFRAEFPRNALMKVLKRQLRDPYWEAAGLGTK